MLVNNEHSSWCNRVGNFGCQFRTRERKFCMVKYQHTRSARHTPLKSVRKMALSVMVVDYEWLIFVIVSYCNKHQISTVQSQVCTIVCQQNEKVCQPALSRVCDNLVFEDLYSGKQLCLPVHILILWKQEASMCEIGISNQVKQSHIFVYYSHTTADLTQSRSARFILILKVFVEKWTRLGR